MNALLVLLTVFAQTPDAPTADRATLAAERAATAAEKAADAAEKVSQAAARIADAVAGPEKKAGAPAPAVKKPEGWAGTVGLGLTFITGNSQMLTLTGTAAADRTWGDWSMQMRANGAYGLSNPSANVADSTSSVTAKRATGTVRGDRAFGGFAALFVLGGAEFDHMKNIESRAFGEAGTGLTFFNEKKDDKERLFLRLDLAMRAGHETRFQYFPTPKSIDPYAVVILAPRAAITFRWTVNEHVRFSEEIEFIPFVLEPNFGRLLMNNTTKLNAKLTESIALATALVINSDSTPPKSDPPRLSTDVALTVGIEAQF